MRASLRANVLFCRIERRMSQADLAAAAGVARPVLSKIETGNGDFQISALAKIAEALECSVADLLVVRNPMRSVPDGEIAERLKAPRSAFVEGKIVWTAIDEANVPRAGRTAVAGHISSNGDARTHSTRLKRKAKRKN